MTTGLSASMEDYLQAVYRIQSAKQAARPTDIAAAVGVNNSSVTGALRTLSSRGMVNYAPYDVITLTEEGKRVAEGIVRRREVLIRFFTRVLKAEDGEAETTARGVEHAVSGEILERLVGFVEFLELCPRAGEDWIGEFWTRRGEGRAFEACDKCIASWEEERKRAGFIPERALTEMEVGGLGKIRRINLAAAGRRRLGERGIRPEAVVRLAGTDEAGLEVLSGGYRVRLRRSDAEQIQIQPLSAPEGLA